MTKRPYKVRKLNDGLSTPDPRVNNQYFPENLEELDRDLYTPDKSQPARSCAGCRRELARWVLPLIQKP